MIGWIGFLPKEKYEVRGETWLVQTSQSKCDKNGYFTVTLRITELEKKIDSTHNAHP